MDIILIYMMKVIPFRCLDSVGGHFFRAELAYRVLPPGGGGPLARDSLRVPVCVLVCRFFTRRCAFLSTPSSVKAQHSLACEDPSTR